MTGVAYCAQFALTPVVRDLIIQDRDRNGHRHVLAAYPSGLGVNPRKAAGVLWHLSDRDGVLTIQSNIPPEVPGLLGNLEREFESRELREGDEYRLTIDRNCQKTPPSDVPVELRERLKQGINGANGRAYRSRQVIVPGDEQLEWTRKWLTRNGFVLVEDDAEIGPVKFAALGGKRRGIPYVSVKAHVRVDDVDLASKAVSTGVGRGKNYGLGLLRLVEYARHVDRT